MNMYRNIRLKRYLALFTLICFWLGGGLIFVPPLNVQKAEAATTPFEQGAGYQPGAYDHNAIQPTVYNWTRQSRFTGPSTPRLKWSYKIEGSINNAPVVGADGTIYFTSSRKGLIALNPDGTFKWEFGVDEMTYSPPSIGADGTIYFTTAMPDGITGVSLYAVAPDGSKKWEVIKPATGPTSSPVFATDGTIYFQSSAKFYAIRPDRTTKWEYSVSPAYTTPTIDKDGNIYIHESAGMISCLRPDGTRKSFINFGTVSPVATLAANGNPYVIYNYNTYVRQLYGWDSNGTNVYGAIIPNWSPTEPLAISSDGTFIVPVSSGIWAMSPSGAMIWAAACETYAPIISSDQVVFGAHGPNVYAFNSAGAKKWQFDLGRFNINTPLTLANNNTLYAGATIDGNGYIVAIADEGTIPVTGIIVEPTSMTMAAYGKSMSLAATISPSDASNQSLLWTSSNPAAATVDETGLVTPQAPGTTTITVMTLDGEYKATAGVNVTTSTSIAVTGISLDQSSLSLNAGQTPVKLVAAVQPSTATNKSVFWTSSDPKVATVNSSGWVTPVAPGTATIQAKSANGGHIAVCQVTVNGQGPVSVSSVVLDKSALSLVAGGATDSLKAMVQPTNAANQAVTWTSSNPNVATINSTSGVVTPLMAGTTTIVVKTEDGGFTAACQVTVTNSSGPVSVTGVALSQTTLELVAGGAASTLKATVQPTNAINQAVTWTSSSPTVATVNEYGAVRPLAVGTALITVKTSEGGFTDVCRVTVTNPSGTPTVAATGVTLDKTTLNLTTTDTPKLLMAAVQPMNASNQGVTWTSSNPSVASINANGLVTPLAVGTTTITVKTTDGGFTATCEVTVTTGTVAVSGVSLDKSSLSMIAGGSTYALQATVQPTNATNKGVTWMSSNPGVASVDANGTVTPKTAGAATITVKTNDGSFSATCQVSVASTGGGGNDPVAVTGVTIDPTTLTLAAGGTKGFLNVSVQPTNATNKNVSWTSSNPNIATVESDGAVNPLAAGTATITVRTNDGDFNASCVVTVTGSTGGGGTTTPVTGVKLNRTALNLAVGGGTGTLSAIVQPFNASDKTITWTSSEPAVATVDGRGVVTPVAAGTTTITAKSADGGFSVSCLVTVLGAPVPLTNVQVEQPQVSLPVSGEPFYIPINFTPANATNTNLVYVSSNPKVAKVDPTGLVTSVGPGSAVITIKSPDGSFETTCVVNVATVSISNLMASEYKIVGQPGETYPFKVYAVYNDNTQKDITTDAKTTYRSTSEKVVTVEPGLAHIQGAGSAEIAVSYEGATFNIPVTGKNYAPVKMLVPSTRYVTLKVDEKAIVDLTAFFTDGTSKNVTSIATWTTNNSPVATVNSGEIFAHSPGTALITGWFGGQSVVIRAEVVPDDVEEGLMAISADARNVVFFKEGEEKEVKVFAHYENGDVKQITEGVEWHSQDNNVVDVANDGVLTAIGNGTTMVIATYKGKSAEVRCFVKNKKVKRLVLNKSRLQLKAGATQKLILTVTYSDGTKEDVTNQADWSSVRPYIAEVTDGVVKGENPGRTRVLVTYADKTLSIPVTVVNAVSPLKVVGTSPLTKRIENLAK